MASSADATLCSSCELHSSAIKPKTGIVNCIGCQKSFCIQHIGEHRQELSAELEIIVCQRNIIQEALESSSFDVSAELALINTWIKETIDLVNKTAADAREKLENLAIKHREELKAKCQELTSQIETFHQSENYFECDLASLKTSFDQLAVAKNNSNTKVVFPDVAYALDKAIQVSSEVCTPYIGMDLSFIEKLLTSAKPNRQLSLPQLYTKRICLASSGAILIEDSREFLFVDSDGSIRSLSKCYIVISNIRWSTHLNRFLYYHFFSHKEPTVLISVNPSVATGLEEAVTPKKSGPIKCFAVFENSLLVVCEDCYSTQAIEEWSLDNEKWFEAEQPKYCCRSPLSCLENENFENIAFHRDYIALIIRTSKRFKSFRFELRSRKMVIQGHVPLDLPCLSIFDGRCKLQRVPDGWLFQTNSSSNEPKKFVLISNGLNLYEQSRFDYLNLADVVLVDGYQNRKKLLVALCFTSDRKPNRNEFKLLFYEIE